MKRFIRNNLWIVWLTISLNEICGLNAFSWNFWIIVFPTILLVSFSVD